MELKVQIPFQQLLSIVKTLTQSEKEQLRMELDERNPIIDEQNYFVNFLLNGPVYSDEEIGVIEENRKSIAAWRTED